jgi:hypothetical protein
MNGQLLHYMVMPPTHRISAWIFFSRELQNRSLSMLVIKLKCESSIKDNEVIPQNIVHLYMHGHAGMLMVLGKGGTWNELDVWLPLLI